MDETRLVNCPGFFESLRSTAGFFSYKPTAMQLIFNLQLIIKYG
jgi:hypothetical protein